MNILTQFAETGTATGSSDIFTTLGIDWKILILQIVAFLILVWLLGRFVYPILMKSVDKRNDDIEEATRLADEAKKHAEETEQNIQKLLKKAQDEAADVVSTAKQEAAAVVEAAEKKSKKHAESIIESAHSQIERDVIAAKKALRNETIDLIALATEKVVNKKLDAQADKQLIETALKESN